MPLTIENLDRKRLAVFLAVLLAVILLIIALARPLNLARAGRADPNSGCCRPTQILLTATRSGTFYSRLCGRLIYLVDVKDPTIKTSGLLPCSAGKPLIFKVHPRDNIPYFQFRDVTIKEGDQICDKVYGCLDQYITNFKNYIGIDSCLVCGISNLPPTWTQAPLTPYTFTPAPPTATLYIPSPTSTDSPTPTLGPVTNTPNLFEILHGTPSPELSASAAVTQTQAAAPPAALTAAPAAGPTPTPAGRLPAVCGSLLAPLLLALAYFLRLARLPKSAG